MDKNYFIRLFDNTDCKTYIVEPTKTASAMVLKVAREFEKLSFSKEIHTRLDDIDIEIVSSKNNVVMYRRGRLGKTLNKKIINLYK
jgi:hypothetical protein